MKAFICLVCLTAALFAGACIKKVEKISTTPARKNALAAGREELIKLINDAYGAVQFVKYGKMGVQVEGFYFEEGKKESYPKGSGYMVVGRPHWILMNINNPLTHSTVAAMAANGEIFQLFVPGENKYVTGRVNIQVEQDNPFYNIRPQHVVEAIFVRPLENIPGRSFYVFEESDFRFSYYVIAEFEFATSQPRLLRRLWIERSDLRLARQQWYGLKGELVGDATYGSQAQINGLPVFLELNLIRPLDRYRLHFTFPVEAAKVNEPLEPGAFAVQRPPGAELVEVKDKISP